MTMLRVLTLPHGQGLPLPVYESQGAAGMDLRAALPADQSLVLYPGRYSAIPTGLIFAIPAGFEGQVRPRSGLALRHGITVLNAPGTIDADYRGEVSVLLINHGDVPVTIERGQRIAQLVICPVSQTSIEPVTVIEETARGAGGFGSTGLA